VLTRRSFLALTGGVALLAACSSDGSGDASGDIDFTEVSAGIVSSDLHADPKPQRLAFAVLAKQGYASGEAARVAIAPPGETPSDWVEATLHAEGLPERRAIYTIEPTLAVAGNWSGRLDYGGEKSDFAFTVDEKAEVPLPGDTAPAPKSPTVDDPDGVDPICTRDPQCPLHQVSLDEVIGSGRPVAVYFGTPALCQTQYCGPVLDTLLEVAPDYQDRIDVVHVEIYTDLTGRTEVDAVQRWGLPSEPWLFAVDGDGQVVARLDGAFDASEMRDLLDQLV
jgi:hypothetical protein